MELKDVKPGNWAVIGTGSKQTTWIEAGERMAGHGRKSRWDHAVIASRWVASDVRFPSRHTLMIVEAEPGGAREVPWHYEEKPHLWSAGIIPADPFAGHAAMKYAGMTQDAVYGTWTHTRPGVGYSAADYLAIGLHSLHIPAPGLKDFIADSGHMICSELVDQACQDANVHLFDDGRWPGYVMPASLGWLLEGVQ